MPITIFERYQGNLSGRNAAVYRWQATMLTLALGDQTLSLIGVPFIGRVFQIQWKLDPPGGGGANTVAPVVGFQSPATGIDIISPAPAPSAEGTVGDLLSYKYAIRATPTPGNGLLMNLGMDAPMIIGQTLDVYATLIEAAD